MSNSTMAWIKKGEPERQVFLAYTEDLKALTLRVATSEEIKNQPGRCFLPSTETAELWLTIIGRKLPLARSNVMLTGKKVNKETGNAEAFVPEITVNRLNKEKTEIVQKPFAFSVKQIEAMTPTPANLILLANRYGAPLLIVGQIPYVSKKPAKAKVEQPEIERVRLEKAESGEPEIVRVKA